MWWSKGEGKEEEDESSSDSARRQARSCDGPSWTTSRSDITNLNLDTHRRGGNPLTRKINCRMRSCSLRERRGRKVDGFEVELNVHPLLFPSSSFFPRQFSQDRGSTSSDCISPIPLVSSSSSLFALYASLTFLLLDSASLRSCLCFRAHRRGISSCREAFHR